MIEAALLRLGILAVPTSRGNLITHPATRARAEAGRTRQAASGCDTPSVWELLRGVATNWAICRPGGSAAIPFLALPAHPVGRSRSPETDCLFT